MGVSVLIGASLSSSFQNILGGAKNQLHQLGSALEKTGALKSQVERYRFLGNAILQTRREFQAAQHNVLDLAGKMAAGTPTKVMAAELEKAREKTSRLASQIKADTATLKLLGAGLKTAGIDTKNLAHEQVRNESYPGTDDPKPFTVEALVKKIAARNGFGCHVDLGPDNSAGSGKRNVERTQPCYAALCTQPSLASLKTSFRRFAIRSMPFKCSIISVIIDAFLLMCSEYKALTNKSAVFGIFTFPFSQSATV